MILGFIYQTSSGKFFSVNLKAKNMSSYIAQTDTALKNQQYFICGWRIKKRFYEQK